MIWDPQWDGIENPEEMTVYVTVWPNPASSIINVKGDGVEDVFVYNSMGYLVMSIVVPDSDSYTKIDASSLDSGIYFLNIVSSNGNSVLKKVVVQ